jgi:beta-phosphoglucomutase
MNRDSPSSLHLPLRGFIFDMDGVLVDNSRYYALAWERFLQEFPGALDPNYPAALTFGRRNSDLLPEVYGRVLPPDELAAMSSRLEAIYRDLYFPDLAPVEGVVSFLRHLHAAGFPLALASSAPRANVDMIAERIGVYRLFTAILAENDVIVGKPDPQIYLDAAARIGCSTAECLIFEDAIVGVAAALASGAKCVALSTTYPESDLIAAGAAVVIRDFADPRLRDFLASLTPVAL